MSDLPAIVEAFPSLGTLKFVSIDILRLLRQKMQVSWVIVVMTDCFSKFTREVLVTKISSPNVAIVNLESWVVYYIALNIILTDNIKHIPSKCFAALYLLLGTRLITTAEY